MNAIEYLEQHGLDPEFVKNKLAWSWDESTITIPHFDIDGTGLFNRYRHLVGDTKFSADKGSHATLYGAHRIKNHKIVIFCEGEPDTAKILQEGFSAVTAGGVQTFTAKLANPLTNKEVILLLDNDEAGQSAIGKYCDILLKVGATPKIAQLPEGVKDVCEYFVNGGDKDNMQLILDTSLPYDIWQEQHLPEEFKILESSEILAKELPEQEWFIDRILPVNGITTLIGAEGTGKSFYTLTMGDAVANGEKWLNTFEVKQKAKVLFIDKENVMRRIQNRMKGLGMTGKNMYHLAYPQYFRLEGEKEGFSEFALEVKRFVETRDIGLIVIDSMTDLMVGNENSAGDTQEFFDGIRQLFGERAILIIHHASKPSQGVVRTAAQKSRGSTNIMAQAVSSFYIEQMPRSSNAYSVEHIKAGDTEKIKKFKVEMEIHRSLYDKDKTSVIGLHYKGEIEDEELKAAQAEEIVMEALGNTPEMPREDMEALCMAQNVMPRTFQRTIKKMKDEKVIDIVKNPDNKLKRIVVLL